MWVISTQYELELSGLERYRHSLTPQFEKGWLFPGLAAVKASRDSWWMSKCLLSNPLLHFISSHHHSPRPLSLFQFPLQTSSPNLLIWLTILLYVGFFSSWYFPIVFLPFSHFSLFLPLSLLNNLSIQLPSPNSQPSLFSLLLCFVSVFGSSSLGFLAFLNFSILCQLPLNPFLTLYNLTHILSFP